MWESFFNMIPQLSVVAVNAIIMGGILAYIFWKYIPGLNELHAAERKELREQIERQQTVFLATLDRHEAAHENSMEKAVASNVGLGQSIDRLTTALLVSHGEGFRKPIGFVGKQVGGDQA